MIVQTRGDRLYLITQPDHAGLARRVMDGWRSDGLIDHPRRASILRAIERHDDGWAEVDAAPLVDAATGQILDFLAMPRPVTQGIWPRALRRLGGDPWAAALVAEHALHIHAGSRGTDEWASFFEEIEGLRVDALARTGRGLDELETDYAFVRVADLVSLVFCNRWSETRRSHGHAIGWTGDEVRIEPDPFDGASMPLTVAARILPNRSYRDAADAAAAWHAAAPISITGVARGAQPN